MSDVIPNEESVGPETSDDLQEISTEAVNSPKKRRLRIALAAGVALLLLVALLAVTLGRDSGRSVTLVIVDKTSENPLPPDLSITIASDAPQYPKMNGKRAEVDLGNVGHAGKPLAVTFETPNKSVVKFVFPKKLPEGDLVVLASLEDNEITARLGGSKASAARKNPVAEARTYAVSERSRVYSEVKASMEWLRRYNAKFQYDAIWGEKATAPNALIAQRIQDFVIAAYRDFAVFLNGIDTDSPEAATWLSAAQQCEVKRVDEMHEEWVRASTNGNSAKVDQAVDERDAACDGGKSLDWNVLFSP